MVDLSAEEDVSRVQAWVEKSKIRILNIAGPWESEATGIYARAFYFLKKILGQ